jgi:hypothetical protein
MAQTQLIPLREHKEGQNHKTCSFKAQGVFELPFFLGLPISRRHRS